MVKRTSLDDRPILRRRVLRDDLLIFVEHNLNRVSGFLRGACGDVGYPRTGNSQDYREPVLRPGPELRPSLTDRSQAFW